MSKRRWVWRWWAWCLWIFLTLLLLLVLAGLWAWTQRYSLFEDLVVDTLAEQGIAAELDIARLDRTGATLRDVRLSYDGEAFLEVGDLRAEYAWRDALKGRFERLEFEDITARVEVDADGQIVDGWLPPGLGLGGEESTGGDASFPARGVQLTDATLELTTPYGEATVYTDAQVKSPEAFSASVTLAPSDIIWRGITAQGAGVAEITRDGDRLRVDGQLQSDQITHADVSLRGAYVSADGVYDLGRGDWDGALSVAGQSVVSAPFEAERVQLGWDGQIAPGDVWTAAGAWSVEAKRARTPNPKRARDLAETLTLSSALSVVPITEYFSPELTRTVQGVLSGANIQAAGDVDWRADGFDIRPSAPIQITAPTTRVRLEPLPDKTFFTFDGSQDSIRAQLTAQFTQPVGLQLSNIDLLAGSENGWRLDRVRSFAADVRTQNTWRARSPDGEAVRLAPLQTRVNYNAEDLAARLLTLNTTLDYDGPLPGGVVTGLRTAGNMRVRLTEAGQSLDFKPRGDGAVTLDRLQTPTQWVAEDIRFTLPATRNIFTRRPDRATIAAVLQSPDFVLTHPETADAGAQRLDLSADTLDIAGVLSPDRTQDWTATFSEAVYSSETLPGPGTRAQAQDVSLRAQLAPQQPVAVKLSSPSISVQTPFVEIESMQVDLDGTPQSYDVTHSGGRVGLTGTELAVTARDAGLAELPLRGFVQYREGGFAGSAETIVAKAGDAPVNIDYTYANGAGTAQIDVPDIRFRPGSLQPQTLLPALQGKIARVDGRARADLNIAFADGALTESSGQIALIDMNLGTAPGPVEGLNTTLDFSSLFPVQTRGVQTLSVETFNPGLRLEEGTASYRLVPEGVELLSARWPIGNGILSMDPFTWVYAAEENRVTLRIEDVALGDFLEEFANERIEATGRVTGVFPVVVRGVQVLVEGGRVAVPDGGVIRIEPGSPTPTYTPEEAVELIRQQRTDEYSALARDALREFKYRELSAAINGPLDGDVSVGLIFDGSNAKVLNGQPFRFDIDLQGELFNILRSFNSNAQIKTQILRDRIQLPEGNLIGE